MSKLRVAGSVKLFWGAVVVLTALGMIWLQVLGPIATTAHEVMPAPLQRPASGIPAPAPALLVPSPANADWMIPHPGPHGTLPMHYYAAAAVAAAEGSPRIAIMVGGLGEARQPSLAAIDHLPAAVSLALTPYGSHVQAIAEAARKAGHETLMGVPMQTDREPDITEGDKALHEGAPDKVNRQRLDWTLSRTHGYAGVTDEIGMAVEETFLAHDMGRKWLGKNLQSDGLFLVVTSPGAALPTGTKGRIADLIIDPGASKAQETAALNRLGTIAISKGSALGVLATPAPTSVATLAKWCKGLKAQGITLVPVSALATTVTAQ